jgi:(p)ppGpp synthase/HD superfamily hydrolase
MNQITKAIDLATHHYKAKLRNGTTIPYMVHLFSVCKLLAERGCEEDILAAALLHDVVEDTPVTLDQVEFIFGSKVASLVEGATERHKMERSIAENTETWKAQMEETFQFIRNSATVEQLWIILAEKIDNIQSLQGELRRSEEEAVWKRYTSGKQQQQWYYATLMETFQNRTEIRDAVYLDLVQELGSAVNRVFNQPLEVLAD